MRLAERLALAAALGGCGGASPAAEFDTSPLWACLGGAAGPAGLVGAECAYTKAGDPGDACVINPLAVALYAAAGCAGAAVATHLWAPAGAPHPSSSPASTP